VTLRIYDAAGKLVRTLVDEVKETGFHGVDWDGRDEMGVKTAAGVYFCRLMVGGERDSYTFTRKMISLR
jgi:flagellar hook assembly protein FlgD